MSIVSMEAQLLVGRQVDTVQSKAITVSYDSSVCQILFAALRRVIDSEVENLQPLVVESNIFGRVFQYELGEPNCAVTLDGILDTKNNVGLIVFGYVTTPMFLASANELLLSSGVGLRSPPAMFFNIAAAPHP